MSRQSFRVYASALALVGMLLSALNIASAQSPPASAVFADGAVGAVSAAKAVSVPLHSAGIATRLAVEPAGAESFGIVPGGACTPGASYQAGSFCTVQVTFTPKSAGTLTAAVTVRAADGHLLGAARVRGTGLGASMAFTPGVLQPLAASPSSSASFTALASTAGTAYLADSSTGKLLRFDPLTGATVPVAVLTPAADTVIAMAADVDGSLYLEQGSGIVSRVDTTTGVLIPIPLPGRLAGDSTRPTALAIDAEGRLLLALGSRVLRQEGRGWTTVTGGTLCADATAACGDGGDAAHASFGSIAAMIVDAAGDLLLADAAAFRIRKVDAATGLVSTVAGTGDPCLHGGCGDGASAVTASLGAVSGLTVDPLGNLYLADVSRGLRRMDAATGILTSVLPASETRFHIGTVQLAALLDGSVLLLSRADPANPARFTASSSALTFAQTAVGQTSTDSVQAVTVSNLGNAPLELATPLHGTNPSTTADFPLGNTQTCPQLSTSSAAASLAPGESCSIHVKFAPTAAGSISSRVVLTEVASAAPLLHSFAVEGAATPAPVPANLMLISLPSALVYGQPVSLYITVYSNSSSDPQPTGTVDFMEGTTAIAAGVSLSSGFASTTVTHPSTGSHTYAASYSGDSNYAASTQNATVSVNVARAASIFTISVPTYNVSQTIRTTFVLSGQYSGTGIALPSGLVTYTVLDSSNTVLVTGTADHANRVGSIDEGGTIGKLHAGTYTLRLSYPGDTNFLPLQQDYTFVVRPLPQTIQFPIIASPVVYGTPPIPLSGSATAGTPPYETELPVTFSVLSGPGSVVNNQLVITGVGTVVVAADQAGSQDYLPAPQVTQSVVSVRPVATLTWPTPASIVTGTALGATQLNASARASNGDALPGTFTYTPPAGTVLPVGDHTLTVAFLPTDSEHYGTTPLTASVVLTVRDLVTPVLTFPGGTAPFGTGLGGVLNATATANGSAVPGTFVYTTGGTTLAATGSLPVGSYTVTATFTPTDPNNYRGGSAMATITVVRGSPVMSLVTSATPVLLNTPITFTAKAVGGSAVPTGTVQFTSGASSLGSAPIDANGIATLTLNTLPSGSQAISASYSGDGSYNSASATLTEVVADYTFALTASSTALQAVLPGKVASWQFTLAPTVTPTLISDVTFTVTGLPSGATYTVTPSPVAAGGGSTSVTLAVTAPATMKSRLEGAPRHGRPAAFAAMLLLLPFASRVRRSACTLRRAGLLVAVLFASFLLFSTGGCGTGVGYFDQAQTNYAVTISANSGSLSHTAAVTLEIQ